MVVIGVLAATVVAAAEPELDRLWEEVLVLNEQMDDANGKLRQASGSIHMSRPMGLFIRKAIRARVPKTEARAGEPVQCLPIRPESGWLTDQDITTPAYPPTPCSEFKGNPAQAFWHFDKELAEASEAVHRGAIWLPDPTKKHPVPADWPASERKNP